MTGVLQNKFNKRLRSGTSEEGKVEQLKRLIGLAPSERSEDDLLSFIRARQTLVANVLQEFRTRMEGRLLPKQRAQRTQGPKTKDISLSELLKGMKELGLTMEDLKKVKETN